MNKQRIIVLITAGVGVLSCLMPWAKVQVLFFSDSVSGLGVWTGWFAFLGFILAGIFAILGDDKTKSIEKDKTKFVTIGGAVALLFILLTMLIWSNSEGSQLMTFGLGMYLALLSSIALVAIPFVLKGNGDFEMPTKDSLSEDFNQMKDEIVEDVKDLKDEVEKKIDHKSDDKKTEE